MRLQATKRVDTASGHVWPADLHDAGGDVYFINYHQKQRAST